MGVGVEEVWRRWGWGWWCLGGGGERGLDCGLDCGGKEDGGERKGLRRLKFRLWRSDDRSGVRRKDGELGFEGSEFSGIMVELLKQMHLQKEVGLVRALRVVDGKSSKRVRRVVVVRCWRRRCIVMRGGESGEIERGKGGLTGTFQDILRWIALGTSQEYCRIFRLRCR